MILDIWKWMDFISVSLWSFSVPVMLVLANKLFSHFYYFFGNFILCVMIIICTFCSKLLPDPPPPFLYPHNFVFLFLNRIQFAPPIYLWVCNLFLEHGWPARVFVLWPVVCFINFHLLQIASLRIGRCTNLWHSKPLGAGLILDPFSRIKKAYWKL